MQPHNTTYDLNFNITYIYDIIVCLVKLQTYDAHTQTVSGPESTLVWRTRSGMGRDCDCHIQCVVTTDDLTPIKVTQVNKRNSKTFNRTKKVMHVRHACHKMYTNICIAAMLQWHLIWGRFEKLARIPAVQKHNKVYDSGFRCLEWRSRREFHNTVGRYIK
jgi:hypothetical protein